jgi:modulator of FtsH protease HflK
MVRISNNAGYPVHININPVEIWHKARWILLLAIIALGVRTAIYTVDTDSAAVVKRFGLYQRTTSAGIHVMLPFSIETVAKVPVKRVQKEEFGFRTIKAGIESHFLGIEEIDSGRCSSEDLTKLVRESGEAGHLTQSSGLREMAKELLQREYIILTGDLNIVDVEWIVQYIIKDPQQYLFNIKDVRQTIRDSSQAIMRQLVGDGSVDEAITIGRIECENSAKVLLQELLDQYETGIHIVTVKMQSSNPPQRVRPTFNEVNKSLQQKEQRINEAMKQYNEVIPKTKGEALRVIETAKGYAAQRVNQAQGDVSKFDQILTEYTKAKDVTRQRMYLETMNRVLPTIGEKWIVEQGGAEGGILMKLDLASQK